MKVEQWRPFVLFFFSDMAGGSLGIHQAARAEVFACAGLRLSPDNCKAMGLTDRQGYFNLYPIYRHS